MSITIKEPFVAYVPPIAFAGCPIIVRIENAEPRQSISLTLHVSGHLVASEKYLASGPQPLYIDIAEPIRGYVTLLKLYEQWADPVKPLSCGCAVTVNIDGVDYPLQVFPGGTSLGSAESFLTRGVLPALVSTCDGALLQIDQADLIPICLMGTGSVQIKSEARCQQYSLSSSGLTCISLRDFDPRGSIYILSMSGYADLYVAITQSPEECRHTLSWRNSYGVFERTSLTGDFSITDQKEDTTGGALRRFDPSHQRYDLRSERTAFRPTYTIHTGMKGKEFFARTLPDILRSDEIYLKLSYWQTERRCTLQHGGEALLYGSQDQHTPRGTQLVLSEVQTHAYI